MISKFKTIILMLIFIGSIFSFLNAAELNIPLPKGSFKLSERAVNTGMSDSRIAFYGSSLPQNKVTAFYKATLPKAGWKEQKGGYYAKDNYIINITTLEPGYNLKGKSKFKIFVSRSLGEREIAAMHKTKPDKLKFMPVYPQSEQVFLKDVDGGAIALYETDSNIKEVVFFYKSSMLSYRWVLGNELVTLTKSTLIFNRENETCRIEVSNPFIKADDSSKRIKSTPSYKTKISVSYYAPAKKTKK